MDKYADLQIKLKRSIKRHGVPGASIAILKGRRVVATAAAGVTNVDTNVPVTTDTVFQIGSITKVFTATLIMQLVDDGLLSLDTPIVEYLPELRVADAATRRGVTARHLLTHTSGIDGDFFVDSGRGDDAIARLIPMMTLLPSVFPLGTKVSYCNVGFAVLGRVIEVLRRETYDQAMRRRIFRPLGMTHAMTLPEEALRHRCAIGHVASPNDPKRPMPAPMTHLPHGLKSAGTMPAMSAPDLLRFASAHLERGRIGEGKRLLSAASATAMQRQQVRLQKYAPTFISAFGLGWALHDFDGHKVVGHDGGTIGQYSFLRTSPQKRVAVAMLTNGGDAQSVYDEIVATTFGEEIRKREPVLPPIDRSLRVDPKRYVGRYENIMAAISIDAKDGAFRVSNIPKGELGAPLRDMPIAFIDRQTISFDTGQPQYDRQAALFSELVDGRFMYLQVGGRQYRRVG